MDSLTFNLDALQHLSEAIPKKGGSLSLSDIRSWIEMGEEIADAAEEAKPCIDAFISYPSEEWDCLSDEQIESLKRIVERAQITLERIEEADLWTRLFLLVPSIRRRKNVYKLLRQSNERLVTAISTVVSSWEAEREREFEEAASYVLEKNAELHRRLA